MSSITVQAIDQNGAAVAGLYTVLYDSTGQTQLSTGYTPFLFATTTGVTYQVGVGNFGTYTFVNWSDGITTNPRVVTDSGSAQTFIAVYKVSTLVTTDSVTVTASLQSSGVGVMGKTYAFNQKLATASTYTSIGSNVTNSQGICSIIAAGLTPGLLYDFQAIFTGDASFLASSGTATFTTPIIGGVDNSNVSIAITTPPPFYPTTTIDFTATLMDTTLNQPMNGQTLSFNIDGISAGTLTTNTAGVASGTASPLAIGNHVISVSFAGNANVLASSSSSTVVVVKSVTNPPPPATNTKVLVAGVAIGGAALVAGYMLLNKKKR